MSADDGPAVGCEKDRLQRDAATLVALLEEMGVELVAEVRELGERMLEWRRRVHWTAETCFKEVRTAALVAEQLRGMEGVSEVRTGIACTGVTALVRGGLEGEGRVIMCRADMDALPIPEDTGLPFASTNGNSHACGHDGHTAMLLAAASVLGRRRASLRGVVMLLFQPAEEGGGGAREMLKEDLFPGDLARISECYGIHLWNTEPLGTVSAAAGPNMAASDRWTLDVRGRGGHGAAPHETVDPIVVAAHVVTALQTVVSRSVDPLDSAVVTVGTIHGGVAPNVIPGCCTLSGTARSLKPQVQDLLVERMTRLSASVAEGFGATAVLNYIKSYPVTVSTPAEARHVREAASLVVGPGRVVSLPPIMGGEDFSFFLQRLPGCFFFVGSAASSDPRHMTPHHRADFTFHEAALFIGASIWVQLVASRLV